MGGVAAALVLAVLGQGAEGILREWKARSDGWGTVEVRFERESRRPRWGALETGAGRLFLGPGDGFAMETVRADESGRSRASRVLWGEGAVHVFDEESARHVVSPVAEGDRGKLPAEVRLAFLWGMDPAKVRERYSVKVVGEQGGQVCLEFSPGEKAERGFDTLFVILDRASYLPRRMVVVGVEGDTESYKIVSARTGGTPPASLFLASTPAGWKDASPPRALSWLMGPSYRGALLAR